MPCPIEKTLATLMTNIPLIEEIAQEEWKELDAIESEMKKGQRIPLEELEKTLRTPTLFSGQV